MRCPQKIGCKACPDNEVSGKSPGRTTFHSGRWPYFRSALTDETISPKYNKHYVGLPRHGVADNFVSFKPRKKWVLVELCLPFSEELKAELEETF